MSGTVIQKGANATTGQMMQRTLNGGTYSYNSTKVLHVGWRQFSPKGKPAEPQQSHLDFSYLPDDDTYLTLNIPKNILYTVCMTA